MSLYDQVLARAGGGRALAVSRLKRAILASLHEAFAMSRIESQSDLARRLHVRRSAVNQVFLGDGNVRISTLAEYLYEMGYELDVALVRAGEPRAAALEGRRAQPAIPDEGPASASVFYISSGSQMFAEQSPAATPVMGLVHASAGLPNSVVISAWTPEITQSEARSASVATPVHIDEPGDA
jgi:transcriptional regulator with XRE-family HTH domain